MYKLKNTGLKWLKFIHLVTASAWLGGAFALTLLNGCDGIADREGMLYGINVSAHLIDVWVVSVSGAAGSVVTGIVYGLFTHWGFFKHRWVMWKWLLTAVAGVGGIGFLAVWEALMLDISDRLGQAALQNDGYLSIRSQYFVVSLIQIGVLIAMFHLSVFRPGKKKKKV